MRIVNALRVFRRKRPALGVALALGIFLVAFELRFAFGDALKVVPFITLFPAILLAALVGGLRAGILVAILSGLTGWYWFVAPLGSFWLPWDGYLVMTLFMITAAIQLYVIRTLNTSATELRHSSKNSSIGSPTICSSSHPYCNGSAAPRCPTPSAVPRRSMLPRTDLN